MTKAEMQEYIRSIISAEVENGFEIFACLKEDSSYNLKYLRATDDLINNTESKILTALEQNFLPEDVEYDTSDNIADNKKALYEVQQDEAYHPFDLSDMWTADRRRIWLSYRGGASYRLLC